MIIFSLGNFLAIGLGAACGAILRWILGLSFNQQSWPWGTFFANCLGGLLIGIMIGLLALHKDAPEWLRLFLVTGFLGGLTTFSTFSAETIEFFIRQQWLTAFAYMGSSLVCTLGLTAIGMQLVRTFS